MRAFAAIAIGLLAVMVCFTAAVGLAGSWPVATCFALAGGALVGWRAWARPFVPLDESACTPALKALSALATVGAIVMLGRLTLFMADPQLVRFSPHPSSRFESRHCCLTAYYVAGQLAGEGRDPYDPALYRAPEDDGKGVRKPRQMGVFNVDQYEYPPPFLLLPRLFTAVVPDFLRLRALWFALNLGLLFTGVVVTARLLEGAAATRAFLLSPLVWPAWATLSLLQKGNVQGTIFVLALLGMALHERRRHVAGGALLAFAVVSKLYPGPLVAYLLVRRQWRAAAWTVGFGIAFALASLLDTGWGPQAGFLHHLPGLLGGQAFPAFRNPLAIAINYSIPGLAFKARLFDVPGMGYGAARVIGTTCTLAVLAAIAWVGQRRVPASRQPLVCLALLLLASLCSPFLPQGYAGFPPIWLLTLLAALHPPNGRILAGVVAGWLCFNLYWPQDVGVGARTLALMTLVPQALTVALAIRVLRVVPAAAANADAALPARLAGAEGAAG
ncbi:MAG TPA: glycosyltransferase family 87 protein [Vicinamibacteria bacterium]|nr:glycosyltransferase family 87 protein [Vicinamibacteria bacterium]